jgi:PAS domain S-box-containing protein
MNIKPTYEELEKRIRELEGAESEHTKAILALRDSEARFRLLYERAPLGYQSLDENGRFLEVNQAWLDALGYTHEEVIGKSFGDFVHADWSEHFKENFPRFKAIGEVLGVEFEMVKKDGSTILVSFNGKIGLDEKGEFKQTHCILHDITRQRRSEEALRLAKDKAQKYLDIAGVMFLAINAKGEVSLINQKGSKILGYKQEEIIGKNWFDSFLPRGLKDQVKNIFDRLMAGEVDLVEYNENPILTKDNEERIIAWNNTILKDEQGNIIGTLSSGEDITKRKQAEKALSESEKRLKTILDSIKSGIVMIDVDTHEIVDANPAAIQMIGATKEEIIGSVCHQYICPAEKGACPISDLGQKIDNSERILIQANGVETPIIKTATNISINGKEYLLENFIDITEKKKLELQMQDSERRYRTVADFTYDWEYWVAPDGNYIYISPSCQRITGYSANEFVKNPLLLQKIIHPEDRDKFLRHLDEIHINDEVCQLEFRIFRRDGEKRWIDHRCQPVLDPEGINIGRRCTNRDITYQKKIELDLKNQRQMLIEKTISQEKANETLKAMLDQREIEKKSIEQSMVTNLKRYVFPYLDDLEGQRTGKDVKIFVNIIRTNIEQLISPVSNNLSGVYLKLTPTEIKIADLIRQGNSTKTIAGMLNISISTVEKHRNKIRKKLNLLKKKVNLYTYLNSLP